MATAIRHTGEVTAGESAVRVDPATAHRLVALHGRVRHPSRPEATAMPATPLAWPALLRPLDRVDPGFRV